MCRRSHASACVQLENGAYLLTRPTMTMQGRRLGFRIVPLRFHASIHRAYCLVALAGEARIVHIGYPTGCPAPNHRCATDASLHLVNVIGVVFVHCDPTIIEGLRTIRRPPDELASFLSGQNLCRLFGHPQPFLEVLDPLGPRRKLSSKSLLDSRLRPSALLKVRGLAPLLVQRRRLWSLAIHCSCAGLPFFAMR